MDRTKLHPEVRRSLQRPPEIYDQLVSPNYSTSAGTYSQLLPIDLENLGNDADGCRILIVAKHRGDGHGIYSWGAEWDPTEIRIHLAQRGFLKHGEFTTGQLIPGDGHWTYRSGVTHNYFMLGQTDFSGDDAWRILGNSNDDWWKLYTFYPGSLSTGLPAPFNANQTNNASNVNTGGPRVEMNIVSVTAESGVVTVVTRTGHAIQTGNTVTLSGITGAGSASLPDPNGNRAVTAIPSRNSFQFSLAGANGSYSGGWTPTLDSAGFERLPDAGYRVETGYAKVSYQPTYSKFRIWLAAHIHVSVRVIVYDN